MTSKINTPAFRAYALRRADEMTTTLHGLLAVCYLCLAMAVLTTIARVHARFHLVKNFGVDDYLMICATVGILSMTPFVQFVHDDYCRGIRIDWLGTKADWAEMWPKLGRALKSQWAASLIYPLMIGLLKLSVLAFYRRFLPRHPYHRLIAVCAFCTGGFSVAAAVTMLLQCTPISRAFHPSNLKCPNVDAFALNTFISAFGLLTDLVILLLPVPVVLRLQVDLKQRLALMLVFSLGTAGTVLTALRLWKSARVWQLNRRADRSAYWQLELALLVMLSYIEVCTIAVCANLPTLAGWWRKKRHTRRTNISGAAATAATAAAADAAAPAAALDTNANSEQITATRTQLPRATAVNPVPPRSINGVFGALGAACSTTAARAWSAVTSSRGHSSGTAEERIGGYNDMEQSNSIAVACSIRMESMSVTDAEQHVIDEKHQQDAVVVRQREVVDFGDPDAKSQEADEGGHREGRVVDNGAYANGKGLEDGKSDASSKHEQGGAMLATTRGKAASTSSAEYLVPKCHAI